MLSNSWAPGVAIHEAEASPTPYAWWWSGSSLTRPGALLVAESLDASDELVGDGPRRRVLFDRAAVGDCLGELVDELGAQPAGSLGEDGLMARLAAAVDESFSNDDHSRYSLSFRAVWLRRKFLAQLPAE